MHTTGSYYLNADTMAFMQFILSDLFKDFPKLRLIIPHGGGAVPFHWGRFRGLALTTTSPSLTEIMANNIFFDTCVYHQPGIDLLFKVVPVDNILFASEMVGAVRGNDPKTGFGFDDTKRYVEGTSLLGRRQGEGVRGQCPEGLSAHQQEDLSSRRNSLARPHPEEPSVGSVSKDGCSWECVGILRDGASRLLRMRSGRAGAMVAWLAAMRSSADLEQTTHIS